MKTLLVFSLALLASAWLIPDARAQAPSTDPLAEIDAKKRELQLEQVKEKGRVLKDLQRTATAKGDLEGFNALQALLDEAASLYQKLQNPAAKPVAVAPPDPDAGYHQGLQGRVWKGKGETVDLDLSFEGADAIFQHSDGKVFKYRTEVVWPGLLRYKPPNGGNSYLVFDDDGKLGALILYTTEFPGTLMDGKGE